jgi:DNA-binding HxlR family transcriptional regulator
MRGSPVARAIRLLGDRWSILVIRDAFQGVRRFEQFLERSGASRATLARRLRSLVAGGILVRAPSGDSPGRFEYRLTPRGRELFPLSMVAWNWERRWAPRGAGIPLRLRHRDCGHEMRPETACAGCGEVVALRDVSHRPGPGVRARAPARSVRSARLSGLTGTTHRGSRPELAHVADIVGDPWTPLVLSAAFFGLRRFDEIQREIGIATNTLAGRLERLVRRRILERRPYQQQPPRFEYRLTAKGRDLFPYALVLNAWGDRWLGAPGGSPFQLVHRGCGRVITPVVRCSHCHVALAADAVTAAAAEGRTGSAGGRRRLRTASAPARE